MGRPRAIQGDVEKRLLEALESGLTIRLACAYAGISDETYREECHRNPGFAGAATRARLTHLPKALDQIRQAGRGDWRAAAKFAEMIAPDDFGRRIEVTGAAGGPVKVATEVQPGFVADVLRRLGERSDAPAEEGGE